MNIITKTQYVCPLCGKESEDRTEIEECAASHSVVDESVPVVAAYSKGVPFPNLIEVTMTDRSVIRYQFVRAVELPPDEETETEDETGVDA